MNFRSKNLLVTGGAGFIGSNFIEHLFNKYNAINIYNLDLLTYAGNLENTHSFASHPNYTFIEGDICDELLLNNIFKKYQIDGIINFAAESHVDNSINHPDIFIRSNINGVLNLLKTSYSFWMDSPFKSKKEFNFARFHQVSTDEVYGSIDTGSFSEKSQYLPNSPYSASKASADMLVRSYNKTFGLNTTISISSNNYGKNQHKEKFIPKIIDSIIKNKDIVVYGNGLNIRNWIFVSDNCEAIDSIFNNSISGKSYNVASQNEFTNLELVNIIHAIINKKQKVNKKIHFIDDRHGHDFRYSIDINEIKKDLKWKPISNFLSSLELVIDNYIIK